MMTISVERLLGEKKRPGRRIDGINGPGIAANADPIHPLPHNMHANSLRVSNRNGKVWSCGHRQFP